MKLKIWGNVLFNIGLVLVIVCFFVILMAIGHSDLLVIISSVVAILGLILCAVGVGLRQSTDEFSSTDNEKDESNGTTPDA